ncbi:MAG: DNA polymerase I [Balneolaceae bacterium]|nr:MAG: DNA polymerase I [Balneolaceae bacterium]
MSKKKLYLLDGMALAYRAHFAFIKSRLQNSEGIATGPILGFANTLVKLLEEDEPTHIAVAWDTHAPTFRHELDEEYKANRPPQPDELRAGIPLIKEMISGFGISNIEQDGFEADDIIGTIASLAKKEDADVFLVTPDKDFMQLVDHHIHMLKPDNKNGGFIRIDREGVLEYFGVYPEQVIDVLAIIGDTSDNIPGVPGIGKKGAPTLIREYGSLEKAIEAAPEMKSKRNREGLTQFSGQALHAKIMVTIRTDVPDVAPWQSMEWKGADRKTLGLFFKRMEFRTLTRKYLGSDGTGQGLLFDGGSAEGNDSAEKPEPVYTSYSESETGYKLIETVEEIRAVIHSLNGADMVCFDTETDGTDPLRAKMVGLALSSDPKKAWYIPVNTDGALTERELKPLVEELFGNESVTKVAHNYKFDWLILKNAGIEIRGPVFDTMIAAYLIDSSQKLKMDDLSRKYLQYDPVPIEKLIGSGKEQRSMADLPPEEVFVYACEDADITLRLALLFKEHLQKDDLWMIARDMEFPLVPVLAGMERNGVRIDTVMLNQFSAELTKDMDQLESEIFEKAGEEFNLNSPQQLGTILFGKLGLPSGRKTKTGQYSTSESVLSELAVTHELPSLILDYRSLTKLRSTYVDALPRLADPLTQRIHTDFNQTVTATGRLSSSSPNLQNIPIRTARGREIRKAFIPEKGFRLMAADYSQVELRVIASISEDEQMMQAFKNREDIHSRTAMELFGLSSADEVTPDHRRKAKEVNFGIPYGVSAYGLASRLGISNAEGKELIDRYFGRFPGIQSYIDTTIEFAREHGYVATLLGRRRYIPDIRSSNWNLRGFAERTAINMPIQGTAADIIKLAMIDIQGYLAENQLQSRMLLQVHDELVFEIEESETETVPLKIRQLMEEAFRLKVPLVAETGVAGNWLEAH